MKRKKVIIVAISTFALLWGVALIAIQVLLSSSFLTKTAEKYVSEYVDADVSFGRISASVFKSFPNLNVEVSDVRVTYPHDRFAPYDSIGVDGILRHAGRGDDADTLASFRKMSLSVNYISALFGRIHVREASLDRPRIFAHQFSEDKYNWDVLKNIAMDESETEDDTTVTFLPPITVDKVALTGRPHIVYTDVQDTIYAAVMLRQMHFHGRLTTVKDKKNHLGLNIDSLFVSGRLPADTVAVAVDRFDMQEKEESMDFTASAKAFLGMNEYGRLIVPMSMSGSVSFPESGLDHFLLNNMNMKSACVEMTGNADIRALGDSTYIRAEAAVNDCSVNELIRFCGKNFFPAALDLTTDAKISFTALCDGYYNSKRGTLPELVAEFVLPKSYIRYPGVPEGHAEIDINAVTDSIGKLDISFDDMCLNFGGIDIDGKGSVSDAMGADPLVRIDSKAYASLGQMMAFLPDSLGYLAQGEVNAALSGKIRMSQMDIYNFYGAALTGYIRSRNIILSSEKDSLYAWIGNPEVKLGTVANRVDTGIPRGTRLLAVTARVDSLYATYGKDMAVRGSGVGLVAQNAYKSRHADGGHEHNPIVGALSFNTLLVDAADSMFMGVAGSENTFHYSERCHGRVHTPAVSLVSDNARVFAKQGVNRFGFRNAKISASALLATFEHNQRKEMLLDSLKRIYPGVPRDSLFRKAFEAKMAGRKMPDFIAEADFRKHDIQIPLNETIAKYLKEWDLKGGIDIKEGLVITPYFPLRNVIEDVRGSVTNDAIQLDNFTFRPGASDISASGVMSGLRRTLLGRGVINLDLKIRSQKMDANELLTAYSAGARFTPNSAAAMENSSDKSEEDYLATVSEAHAAAADSAYALVVVPANLNANISLQANEINYSDLNITWLAADMTMKERCIQVTNTVATSNMGDIYFEGFYSTRTKKDIKAGFDLNLSDITADKVVQLFPAVDTIMPMITSFKGLLDCEMAATTDLDTNMNFVTKSMSGIMKIGGRNVTLEDSPEFRKLAKLLMFRNKKKGNVGDMSVSGLISDNRLEIFPFVLNVDRYILAMSGLQNFDQTFKYHVSVLKSPVPFRFGIDIYGNFDNWKYRIGKARYKSTNVPVFTAQVDTLQMNLVKSIHNIFVKGVDLAVRQNESMKSSIDSSKAALGFNPDAKLDSLDAGQIKMLDSLQTSFDAPVDSALNAKIDSLVMLPAVSGDGAEAASAEVAEAKSSARKSDAVDRKEARRQKRQAKRDNKEVINEDLLKDDEQQ